MNKKLLLLPLILVLTLLISYFAYSISVGTTGGSQISFASVTGQKAGVTGSNHTNVSGGIKLNATIAYGAATSGGAFGGVTNLSFVFIHSDGTRSSFNLTNGSVNASSGEANQANLNQTLWNRSIDTTLLKDGNYTIVVNASNYTGDPLVAYNAIGSGLGNFSSNNLVFAILIDNSPPPVTLGANISNGTNYTLASGKIEINITSNDTTSYTQAVKIGVRNDTNEMNLTATRNNSVFSVVILINSSFGLGEDRFNVFVYANDSLNNTNVSIGNFTFTVDSTPPSFTNFSLIYRGIMHFNLSNSSNATPQFMLNYTDNLSISSNCSIFINATHNISNGAVPNATATNLTSGGSLVEGDHIAYASCTDGSGNVGNSTNITALGSLVFRVDLTAPLLTFWANTTNGTNFTTGSDGKIEFNISSNDSVTFTQAVKIGVRNGTNEMNLTATRNFTAFVGVVLINNTFGLPDDSYTVFVYSNDSVGNLNSSVGNISFRVDRTPPSYNLFHMFGRNGSTVNLTNLSAASADFRFNFTDNLSISANCTLYINATLIVSNSSSVNSTATNLTATSMAEGKHIAYVSCTDGSSNQGNTTSAAAALGALTFTVDTIPPNISQDSMVFGNFSGYAGHDARYTGINLSAGLSEGNYTLRVAVNDSSTDPQHIRFNVSNSSGVVMPFNYTAVRNGTNYSAFAFNVSRLNEGWYNLTVWTNDSVNNINGSLRMTFVIDRTLPSVSVTCSPSAVTAGESVTCTCTVADDYPGSGKSSGAFEGGGTSVSTTASGSGTFTSTTCTGVDNAGNRKTATGSWTVSAASSGGGGGGGSGGGSSSGVPTQFEKKVWTSINAGETAMIEVDNGAIGVTEVSFSVAETTYGAWVQVKKVDSLPSSVEAPETVVYRTLEITEQNVQKALQGQATVKFKVEKSWLTDNSVSAANVALFRYVDGNWAALPTTQGENDGAYVHYSATTSGFSYFVIGEAEGAEVPGVAEEAAPVAGEVPAEETVAEVAEGEAVMVKKSNAAVWIVPLVVLIVVAGLLYWYWQRR